MRSTKKIITSAFALLILLSAFAGSAEAGRRYGPAGLGSNLHRRFVVKQAHKNVRRGKPVRGRAVIWYTSPSSSIYRSVPGWSR